MSKLDRTRTGSGLLAAVLALMLLSACDDSVAPYPPITIRIIQPADSAIVSEPVLRILTEVAVHCGCNTHVEFYVNDVHVYSDYLPFYYFDWNTEGYDSGEHRIAARLFVKDVGEEWDSIRVFLAGRDSLSPAGVLTSK
jgi:hypothetical protein